MKTTKKSPGRPSGVAAKRGKANAPATPSISQKKSRQRIRPAGQGGPEQQAGGPDHHGAEAYEDRNP